MASPDVTDNQEDVLLGKLIIPGYVARRDDGVFIDLALLRDNADFAVFINRLFAEGARFSGLDYDVFQKLLFDADWLQEKKKVKHPALKIAKQITAFAPERSSLYRAVKLLKGGLHAEYLFEPVSIEVPYEKPVYGEPDEQGVSPIVEYVTMTRSEPTLLDFDEFVADMWLKGVKFGIDESAVRKVIASGEAIRMQVAHYLEPTEGRDAELKEVSNHLHRDNSPKILANGKADLRVFKNRFPQMTKGERLIKKIPRELGKHGRKVDGELIEPRMPSDIDLTSLASVGTNVEQGAEGEYIVSGIDGFLIIDERTNKVAVAEKIENKGGISARTTGDLSLAVNEFIEHGEVQEGRVVEGKHMTFMSDVYGKVVSQGGNLCIKGCLAGGTAESFGGNVTLDKRASRAVVLAWDGEVAIDFCESSLVVGRVVRIAHAVNSEIIAEEVHIGTAEACMVTGLNISIADSGERRGRETLVTVLIPDFTSFDLHAARLEKEISEGQASVEARTREIASLKSDSELARYLVLDGKIKSGAVQLTDEQAMNWQRLVAKYAKTVSVLSKLEKEKSNCEQLIQTWNEELVANKTEREALGDGIACSIDKVTGQTTVQTMKSADGIRMFAGMPSGEIRALLLKADSGKKRILTGDDGSVDWKFKKEGAS